VSDDAMVLTQRKLLMEMREDINGLRATVDVIAKDQTLGAEDGMTQRGDVVGKERKTGRGERSQTSSTDLFVPVTWALPCCVTGPAALSGAAG